MAVCVYDDERDADEGGTGAVNLSREDVQVLMPSLTLAEGYPDLLDFGFRRRELPEPPPPTPEEIRKASVPEEVDWWKAETIMASIPHGAATLLDAVDAAVAGMDRTAQILRYRTPKLRRDAPLVAMLAPTFSLTTEQVDTLFIEAAKLR